MKSIFLSLFLIVTVSCFGQKTLTGLWSGTLTHDSLVGRKDLSFELALTQYKQKVYGYTRRTFIVRDTLYHVIKRVKGTVDGNRCEITDDEYISYNFQDKVDNKVKVTYTFHYSETDSSWQLNGDWKTNKVRRNYRSMSGGVSLQKEKDLDNSKLLAHLQELKLSDDVAFYKEYSDSKKPVVAIAKPQPTKPEANKEVAKSNNKEAIKYQTPESVSSISQTTTPAHNKNETTKDVPKKEDKTAETALNHNDQKATESSITSTENKNTNPTLVPSPKEQKPIEQTTSIVNNDENHAPLHSKKDLTKSNIPTDESKPVTVKNNAETAIKVPTAAALVSERKMAPPQIVEFKADSLQLSLYDNGEIDGDTVSVLMNGELIIAKQGLKASALKKTIYFPAGKDEFTLLLYAENLGKYPPNTGLLIIRDGEEVHQVRFSADLQQNAAVIFRRKN